MEYLCVLYKANLAMTRLKIALADYNIAEATRQLELSRPMTAGSSVQVQISIENYPTHLQSVSNENVNSEERDSIWSAPADSTSNIDLSVANNGQDAFEQMYQWSLASTNANSTRTAEEKTPSGSPIHSRQASAQDIAS